MSAIPAGWEVVIGLETHTQLLTASKIFSGSPTAYGAAPNTQANAVDLALPGTLPVLNRGAVEAAIKFGLAIGATIAPRSVFARKNYFYPDLPKGYQISQFELPVVIGGSIPIVVDGVEKMVQLTRAHLEEDAGKSLHEGLDSHGVSGIDLNRAGTPLLEIVTEPVMRSAQEAVEYAKVLHARVTDLGICDGNMQEGSFRCDANVSVRRVGDTKLGTRCEIKNVNSFRFLERAIEYEIRRQIELIEDGGSVVQETRLYDADRDETRSMRSKEDSMDYRYFPDPDLLPLVITAADIKRIKDEMPEGRVERKFRYMASSWSDYQNRLMQHLDVDDEADLDDRMTRTLREKLLEMRESETAMMLGEQIAEALVSSNHYAFFDAAAKFCVGHEGLLANWVLGELSALLNESGTSSAESPVTAPQLARLVTRIADQTISAKTAKELLRMIARGDVVGFPDDAADILIDRLGLKQVSDASAIEKIIDEVLSANQKSVDEFKAGKEKAFQALVGQVMKASKGKANPAQVNEILKAKLNS